LERPVTSLEHLIRDYKEGPGGQCTLTLEEYARLVDKVSEDNFAAHLKHLIDITVFIFMFGLILLFCNYLYCKK